MNPVRIRRSLIIGFLRDTTNPGKLKYGYAARFAQNLK
jgi:hypothetical protein